jgi:hypothetical protein
MSKVLHMLRTHSLIPFHSKRTTSNTNTPVDTYNPTFLSVCNLARFFYPCCKWLWSIIQFEMIELECI